MRALTLIDGKRYRLNQLKVEADELVRMGIVYESGNGWWTVDFCGIVIVDDLLITCAPKSWDAGTDTKQSAKLLTRVLLRYREQSYEEERDNAPLMGEGSSKPLVLALQILEDYRAFGLIHRARRIERLNGNGRVKWAKTASRKAPIVSGGSVYFPELVTSQAQSDATEPLCQVHAQVVSLCAGEIGWLLGVDAIPQHSFSLRSAAEMMAVLSREAVRTFAPRELKLISLMQAYLFGAEKQLQNKPVMFGTRTFHTVWEKACACAFNNEASLSSRILPQPHWNVAQSVKGFVYDKNVRQIPDTLARSGDTLLVVDAKYYDVSATLPGWSDIVKQLYYRDSIDRNLASDKQLAKATGMRRVSNAFLMPGEFGTGIRHIGRAEVGTLGKEDGWGMVETYTVDVRECLGLYCAGRRSPEWAREVARVSWPL